MADAPPGNRAFVCFHHPPVDLRVRYVDSIRQFGEERLAEVLARHPHVVGVLCGHSHTPAATVFAGLPLVVAPGVVSSLRMSCEGPPLLDHVPPPMFAFHVPADTGRLTTHFRVVP
ncbi:hypothetical protein [Streptomyces macrosporus]|uniref:Calcineurin-like phosphoesterase domain-containing protein n=1 Tax=Streptomyces macrosporus TaxID=44032 RepID=A0ABP5XMD3_9ACTN